MDKTGKDLQLIYEKNILNEGMGVGVGRLIWRAYEKITGKKFHGVTGIINRWNAGRAVFREWVKYNNYSSIKTSLETIFDTSKSIKTSKAKEQYILQQVQKLAPAFQQLNIPWSEVIQAQQAGKFTGNLSKRIDGPLNNIINEIVQKTELSPSAIDSIFWEPSAAAAQESLKKLMPLLSNLGKSARFWVIWSCIASSMVTFTIIIGKGVSVLWPWLENIERAGRAVQYTGEKVGETADKIGTLVGKLEAAFNGVPYVPDQDQGIESNNSQPQNRDEGLSAPQQDNSGRYDL